MPSQSETLIRKLSKLKKKKGTYSHTTRAGVEVYGPAYYSAAEVDKLVEQAKKIEEERKANTFVNPKTLGV